MGLLFDREVAAGSAKQEHWDKKLGSGARAVEL